MTAATGRQLNTSVKVFHILVLYLLTPEITIMKVQKLVKFQKEHNMFYMKYEQKTKGDVLDSDSFILLIFKPSPQTLLTLNHIFVAVPWQ